MIARLMAMFRHPTWLKRAMNLYPPYLGAGVRVVDVQGEPLHTVRIRMGLHTYNRNYIGTQFGGSLFSMADPWCMLILIQQLGEDYMVVDKSGAIQFRRPGKGAVHLDVHISAERVAAIRAAVADSERGRHDETFELEIVDDEGSVVALVSKVVHVRRREPSSRSGRGV